MVLITPTSNPSNFSNPSNPFKLFKLFTPLTLLKPFKTINMPILDFILLFLAAIIGGILAFSIKRVGHFTSFGGAFVLGVSLVHLLPELFSTGQKNLGLWILLGFAVQFLLEQMSMGIEHGHMHLDHTNRRFVIWQVMIGLCVHAFIEGLPLGGLAGEPGFHNGNSYFSLLMGILIHKAPAALALVSLFLAAGFDKRLVLVLLVVFAAMSPLGGLVSLYLSLPGSWTSYLLAMVTGSFLHISTTILFESGNYGSHSFPWRKLVAVLLGLLLSLSTLLL